MKLKLEQCPFCGGDGALRKKINTDYMADGKVSTVEERYKISCRNCGCGTGWHVYIDEAAKA